MSEMLIPGIRYVPDYLDLLTHDRLLALVDSERWLTSAYHRVQIYGYSYSRRDDAVVRMGALPDWAHELALRLQRDRLVPGVADQMVANSYDAGDGMFAHVDQAVFGDTIASVSLGSTCVMEFASIETDRVEEVLLEPRSVLVLSGEARWRWKHGIPARRADSWRGRELGRSRRVSLTFRIVPMPDGARDGAARSDSAELSEEAS